MLSAVFKTHIPTRTGKGSQPWSGASTATSGLCKGSGEAQRGEKAAPASLHRQLPSVHGS